MKADYYAASSGPTANYYWCSTPLVVLPAARVAVQSEKLSPGEFELLKILWKLESATVAEVRDACSLVDGMPPAYTTTMTVLGRLVDKQAVRVDKAKQPYRYRPALRRNTMLRSRLREFIEICYEGDVQLLLEQLLADGHLSPQELRSQLAEDAD